MTLFTWLLLLAVGSWALGLYAIGCFIATIIRDRREAAFARELEEFYKERELQND